MWKHAIYASIIVAWSALELPARADPIGVYVASAVDLQIAPEKLDAFLAAAKENGSATVKEPGNIAYAISQSADDPNRILLFEVYRDAEGVQAHRSSDHFKKYMDVTKSMVMNRQSRPMKGVWFSTHSP